MSLNGSIVEDATLEGFGDLAPSASPREPIPDRPLPQSFTPPTTIVRGCPIDPTASAPSGRDALARWLPGLRPGLSPFAPLGRSVWPAVGEGGRHIEGRPSLATTEMVNPKWLGGSKCTEGRLNP